MKVKVGVIGTGAIGIEHINRINHKTQGAFVTAVSDINVEAASKIAEEIGAQFFKTGEELIASEEVEVVVVTSWDPTHEKYVLEAIKHGKYVFCEKPLAMDAAGCRRIVDAEVAYGKKLVQVGFMRRYDRGYIELKEAIESKQYGEALMLHCAHRNPSADENYKTPMAISNTAIHEIDVLRWLLDEDYASVQMILPKKTSHTHADLHDPQLLIFQTKSGVTIDLEIFVNCRFGYDIKCDVVFETAEVGMTDPTKVKLLFDTGHLVFSGEDPIAIYQRYQDRIKHIHFKDIRQQMAEEVRTEEDSFLKAVKKGVFTVPGDGMIDFKPIWSAIEESGYKGWIVVEAEQDPAKANPFEYAVKARNYIRKVADL